MLKEKAQTRRSGPLSLWSAIAVTGIHVPTAHMSSASAWVRTHAHVVALAVIMASAAAYWLWFGLTLRNIDLDDGFSIWAAQGVLEHGYPKLPSGFLYFRSLVPTYIVAGSLAVFGVNNFGIMAPSLLLGLGTLFLVYKIAKDIMGMPWLGVAASAVLPALYLESWYATGPRMYMPLQFFTMLAVYGAWRGYIRGEIKHRYLASLAIAGAILSHQEGLVVLAGIFATVSATLLLRKRWPRLGIPFELSVHALLIIPATIFVTASNTNLVTRYNGLSTSQETGGWNLNWEWWVHHLFTLESVFPYALGFLLAGIAGTLLQRSRSAVGADEKSPRIYVISVLITLLAILGLIGTAGTDPPLFFFVLPLYALVALLGVHTVLFRVFAGFKKAWLRRGVTAAVLGALGTGLALSVFAGTVWGNRPGTVEREPYPQVMQHALSEGIKPFALVGRGDGPCRESDRRCSVQEIRTTYRVLRNEITASDIVLSDLITEAWFYLGSVDARITHDPLSTDAGPGETAKDRYTGIPKLFITDALMPLANSDQGAWIIVTSPVTVEAQNFLDTHFQEFLQTSHLAIYNNAGKETAGRT